MVEPMADSNYPTLNPLYRDFGTYEAQVVSLAPFDETTGAVVHTPTVTATGTVTLVNGRILPGGNSPTTRVGGGIRSGAERILKPSTKYLMRVNNSSGSTIAVNVVLEWYEEDVE